MSETKQPRKRMIEGIVVSKSGEKSVKIRVEKRVLHPRYHKIVRRFKNFQVHDEKSELQVGDKVTAIECRPLAKNKNFRLKSYVRPEEVV
ncbi:MAG: 30S ribosomal protein S17 [Helicobacteraceae bacterium]|nr:30S ribosomal protein S17 [Helicobacteraceae bacterium]